MLKAGSQRRKLNSNRIYRSQEQHDVHRKVDGVLSPDLFSISDHIPHCQVYKSSY